MSIILVPRTDLARKKKATQLSFNKHREVLGGSSPNILLLLSIFPSGTPLARVLLHLTTLLFPQQALHFYFLLFFSMCIFCRFSFKFTYSLFCELNTLLGHVNSVIIVFNFRPLGSFFSNSFYLFLIFYFNRCVCMYSCVMFVCKRGRKRASDSPELKLQ